MKNQVIEQINTSPLELGEETQTYLRETKRWANFLSIIGFIFIGLIVILAFFISTIFSALGQNRLGNFPGALFGVVYLLIALLYFFPVLYLFRFANHMGKALEFKNTEDLTTAFRNLKSHYRYIGILLIVMLSFYILAIVIGLGVASVQHWM